MTQTDPTGYKSVLSCRLLGSVEFRMNDVPVTFGGRKSTALLAYLCRSHAHTAPRETLTGLLWGDSQDEQARASLRQTLSAIRRGLEPVADRVFGSDMQSVRV